MIHQPLSPDGVHPQVSSSLRLLVLCLVRPDLFVIYYCLSVFFFQRTHFFHWLPGQKPHQRFDYFLNSISSEISVVLKKTTLSIPDSTSETVSMDLVGCVGVLRHFNR